MGVAATRLLPGLGNASRLAFCALLLIAAPARADTLVDRVDGLTLDAMGRVEHFSALVIGNDGRILQVLHEGEKAPRADYRVDGKGMALIPGLVLGQARVMALGLAMIAHAPPGQPLPPPRPEDRDLALDTAQKALLARGVTTATDMGTSIEDWQAYRRAGDAGRLAMRFLCYAGSAADMVLIGGPGPSPWLYDDRLRMGGLWLDPEGTPPRLSEIQVKNLMSRAAMDHFQVAVRAESPATRAMLAGAIDELARTYAGEQRWRLEQSGPSPDPLAAIAVSADRVAALAMFTDAPARDAFAEGRIGRIAVGKRADFVLLDHNPLAMDERDGAPARVLQTWVGGRLVYSAPVTAAPARGTSEAGR